MDSDFPDVASNVFVWNYWDLVHVLVQWTAILWSLCIPNAQDLICVSSKLDSPLCHTNKCWQMDICLIDRWDSVPCGALCTSTGQIAQMAHTSPSVEDSPSNSCHCSWLTLTDGIIFSRVPGTDKGSKCTGQLSILQSIDLSLCYSCLFWLCRRSSRVIRNRITWPFTGWCQLPTVVATGAKCNANST